MNAKNTRIAKMRIPAIINYKVIAADCEGQVLSRQVFCANFCNFSQQDTDEFLRKCRVENGPTAAFPPSNFTTRNSEQNVTVLLATYRLAATTTATMPARSFTGGQILRHD